MDWDTANVGLDQEAFKAAQAAGDTSFHIPFWVWLVVIVVGIVFAFSVVKKSKDGDNGDGGDKSGGDSK